MTFKRRHLIYILLTVSAVLVLFFAAGCKPGPTTIIGSVSYLNTATMNRPYPPAGHSGDFTDDVAYVRLVDDRGAGATIWESTALDAGTVLLNNGGNPTTDDGEYIGSFVINPTDAQITSSTMPLRLEVFLYDSPVTGTLPILDPGAPDPELYSYYSASGDNNTGWYSLIDIGTHEVKNTNLFVTLPFAP